MALLSTSFEETILPQNVQHHGAGQVVCYLRGIPSPLGKHASLPRRPLGPQPSMVTVCWEVHQGLQATPQPDSRKPASTVLGARKLSICLRAADVDSVT